MQLGTTWIPVEIVQQFMYETFQTSMRVRKDIRLLFLPVSSEWQITHKTWDRGNVQVHSTYGTARANAYRILEDTLNLRDVRVYDYIDTVDGKRKAVLNQKETVIAQGKQELLKQTFQDWIWKEPERRNQLEQLYNERFNSIRVREYDGSHLTFPGMNPEITLRPHQLNAIARILYGGNTLLAHVVGAGKTFEMVAAAQESKRLGLCSKSLFVVPNHLIEQWASEYLQLYPSANILVAYKKDFERENRKKFCSRIATGQYDAIIMGHSQFEKIPMSIEHQQQFIQSQIDDVLEGIQVLKENEGERFQIKAMERTRKKLEKKLEQLLDDTKKDTVITFEELGIDRIFVDEAHYYKNLAVYTKMRNVAGISQTEAQKSSDMFMKCRYLDGVTEGKVLFLQPEHRFPTVCFSCTLTLGKLTSMCISNGDFSSNDVYNIRQDCNTNKYLLQVVDAFCPENIADGVFVFHNPNAKNKLSENFFKKIAVTQFFFEDGNLMYSGNVMPIVARLNISKIISPIIFPEIQESIRKYNRIDVDAFYE